MKPKIAFDTSAFNSIIRDNESDSLLRGIYSGFKIITTGTLVGEIIATKDEYYRNKLFLQLRQIFGYGYCVYPFYEIIRLQIIAYQQNPTAFNWENVDVIARDCELRIPREDLSSDNALSKEERDFQDQMNKQFEKLWKEPKTALDDIFNNEPLLKRPKDFHEAIEIAKRDNGFLHSIGQLFYGKTAGSELAEKNIETFLNNCPPFKAFCYSSIMAWFNWSLIPSGGGDEKRKRAGRNDLLSAAYLPYCDRFISDDVAQVENLRDIVNEMDINCRVLSLDEFCDELCLNIECKTE